MYEVFYKLAQMHTDLSLKNQSESHTHSKIWWRRRGQLDGYEIALGVLANSPELRDKPTVARVMHNLRKGLPALKVAGGRLC